ncbi:hypothetical protein F5Y14DRAFT_454999 [Nemania sp. NC0429]|nr:hypothetical protein F5Y14DRAFT_454999 [Nemania sp. NC0429]
MNLPSRNEVDPRELLGQDGIDEEFVLKRSHAHKLGTYARFKRPSWQIKTEYLLLIFGIMNLAFLVANVSGYLTLKTLPNVQPASNALKDYIRHEQRQFELLGIFRHDGSLNPHKTNSFNGPPRPELEDAWDSLIKNQNLRISYEELGQFAEDDTIIKLSDGSGYFVTIAFYHGLHCVRRLHHYIYKDHYYSNATEWEIFMLRRHAEHCLDWLRQYLQCNVDPTIIPIRWDSGQPGPVSKDSGNHQCVVWEPVEEWAGAHTFDPFTPGLVIHPIFGSPYENDGNASSHDLGITEMSKGGYLHTGPNTS